MRQKDEMDRGIQLRSEGLGYRAAVLALCAWTLFNSWRALACGAKFHPLPGLILCLAVCVQSFSQLAMKQKMVAGDEEYQEPNRLARTITAAAVLTAAVLWIGTYVLLRW